jgi:aromatic ring-opening dioxygenase catalytic subunit (LigB family)
MSFHNMGAYGDPRAKVPSEAFDSWLADTVALEAPVRSARLAQWDLAPAGRYAHPHGAEEHLLPLMVAAGASNEAGEQSYSELVLGTAISAFRFA